jgi:hypothetical protein
VGLSARARKTAIGGLAVASVAGLGVAGVVTASSSNAAVSCGVVFDDFNYSSRTDPALSRRGWSVRGRQGGPGVPGATWQQDNVTFLTVDGQKVARLEASTNGTPGGTTHAEFSLSDRRFFEGTYLARIKFSDAPVSGTDGDIVNQTFYTISPLARPMDPTYSELDFAEYLPNGGWGEKSAVNFQTTWYTYQAEPWQADNQSARQVKSIAGWRDVMATVADGHVKYYIDGQLVADHSGKVYPRQNMSIDFNQWFIDLTGHVGGGLSVWHEHVDYVYHAKKQVLTPAQATAAVNGYRSTGTTHTDTVTADNGCTPSTGPVTPPTPSPTKASPAPPSPAPSRSTPAPVSPTPGQPPVGGSWAPYTPYVVGQVVTHNGARYEARQAHTSLPGWEPSAVLALWLPI